jgi:hypothetical protein
LARRDQNMSQRDPPRTSSDPRPRGRRRFHCDEVPLCSEIPQGRVFRNADRPDGLSGRIAWDNGVKRPGSVSVSGQMKWQPRSRCMPRRRERGSDRRVGVERGNCQTTRPSRSASFDPLTLRLDSTPVVSGTFLIHPHRCQIRRSAPMTCPFRERRRRAEEQVSVTLQKPILTTGR